MLEKMGWSKGKGLGANLDGEQNFIRVSHKANKCGMGFSDRDDQWTEHEDTFNSLLKSLDNSKNGSRAASGSDIDEKSGDEGFACAGFGYTSSDKKKKKLETSISAKLSGKSLEEQSKCSNARVHYKKFTRGKDLSKYSEKDLANIFGKKTFNEEEATPEQEAEPETANDSLNFGITTIETGTSIAEYFKNKKSKSKQETALEFEVEYRPEAGLAEEESNKKRKKKKKNSTDETVENKNIDISEVSVPTAEGDDGIAVEVDRKKKKKKKSSKEDDGHSNDATTYESALLEKTKKRKRKNQTEAETDDTVKYSDDSVVPPKDKKKKSSEVKNSQPINIVSSILSALIKNKQNLMGNSSTEANGESLTDESVATALPPFISFGENIYEINRYQAEVFRFLDLEGFIKANLCDLAGYGYTKYLELRISAKTRDNDKISDLWDHALVTKYGKDAVKAKKKQKYSMKILKKKNLFQGI